MSSSYSALFAFFLTACCATSEPCARGVAPPTVNASAAACDGLRRAGCPEGQPTKNGVVCERLLDMAAADGMPAADHRACLARASTKDDVKACGEDCAP